jgi:predicted dehydrogenase
MRANPKLRVAVIGAGNMGKNHLRNYFLLPECDLVALADINPAAEKLASEFQAEFYTDYIKMLDDMKPDAVSIVVPTPLHYKIACEVMNRGINCLLEKPIASTVEEADALIKLAQKKQVVFTVGHIEHYNPLVVELKKLLDRGSIGDITSIVCERVGGFPRVEPKTGVITDLAIHDIGIMNYLLGSSPKKVYSHSSRTHHSSKVDSAEVLLDYGKVSGFIQTNWLTPVKIRTISVTGSKGYVSGNYITQELEYYVHNLHREKDETGSFADFIIQMGDPERDIIKVDFEEPLAIELKTFLNHVNSDDSSYLVSPSEAKVALEVALKAAS